MLGCRFPDRLTFLAMTWPGNTSPVTPRSSRVAGQAIDPDRFRTVEVLNDVGMGEAHIILVRVRIGDPHVLELDGRERGLGREANIRPWISTPSTWTIPVWLSRVSPRPFDSSDRSQQVRSGTVIWPLMRTTLRPPSMSSAPRSVR